ncbi:MAG: putative toxin-antitoxin system toxin component, PIN family [Chloroflexia bacterium]|nr:putative toxin-antitoxin system toxin component, PIN family [Chloroflexia bacterium]
MRALLDANIFISYLLTPGSDTPPVLVVEAAFTGAYTLLITSTVIAEVHDKTSTKPYLAARITQNQVARLADHLSTIAETIPEIEDALPEVGSDRKDDYLFAHALVGCANYLVSGDDGVLRIGQIEGVRIVSPAQFVEILRQSDLV